MQQLWDALPSWEQLGSEVLMVGMSYLSGSKHRRTTSWSFNKQLSVMVSRPELADYGLKLLWANAQVEHARGATQAQQVSAATTPKWSRDGDVHMAAVLQDASSRVANAQEPSLLWHLQGECAKLAAGGDWDGVSVLSGAIVALAKGKGKGKGKGTAKGNFSATGCNVKRLPQTPSSPSTFFKSIEIRQR